MKTDDLIRLLASDHAAPLPNPRARLAAGALAGAILAAIASALLLGARPDLADIGSNWRLMVKFAVALSFAGSGAAISLRLVEPFPQSGRIWLALLPGPLILAGACLVELFAMPPEAWGRRALGDNALPCLIALPLLSVLPLVGIVWALREGAPASTSQAGVAAGAMAAGVGAAAYALHCPDDSPLFLGLWYTAAAAMVIVAGRIGGERLLRW